ncbi:hypothetical protein JCM10296v2_000286 [Rhodotorula toruloides]
MRTSFLASFFALATLAVAAPVSVVDETAVEPATVTPETSEPALNTLEKRAKTCSKVSQCSSQSIPANSQHTCSSKKCGWSCKSGYSKSGSKCVKKSSPPPATGNNLAQVSSFSGRGTWYTQDGNPGSCGQYHKDSDFIVAVNSPQVAGGAHCGQHVTITNTANGKTARALVADECPGCSYGGLDLSTALFQQLASLDTGVINIKWGWS